MRALRLFAQTDPGALERVEALVRDRFGLGPDAIVLVSEEPGRAPGLPERMTTVLFWLGDAGRHRIALFKPAGAVRAADLPPAWLRGALRDAGDIECC